MFSETENFRELLVALETLLPLPDDRMERCNIRFLVIFVMCFTQQDTRFRDRISFTLNELENRGYLDKFIAEADYPQYEPLRRVLKLRR